MCFDPDLGVMSRQGDDIRSVWLDLARCAYCVWSGGPQYVYRGGGDDDDDVDN